MKDLLSDIRLADEVRRYAESKAAAFKDQCVMGSIADLKAGDGDLLRNRPILAAEFTELVGKPAMHQTRAFFARELPKPGLWRRTVMSLKAKLGHGRGRR